MAPKTRSATGSADAAASPESLKHINNSTAKFATWIVRAKDPKIIDYEFKARGETVRAQKFQCVLVSQNPKEYMMGTVPFSFQSRQAAQQAFQRFTADSVWEVKTPTFDSKQKPEYVSCLIKQVLSLTLPTKLQPVSDETRAAYPASSVHVPATLASTVAILCKVKFDATLSDASRAAVEPLTFVAKSHFCLNRKNGRKETNSCSSPT